MRKEKVKEKIQFTWKQLTLFFKKDEPVAKTRQAIDIETVHSYSKLKTQAKSVQKVEDWIASENVEMRTPRTLTFKLDAAKDSGNDAERVVASTSSSARGAVTKYADKGTSMARVL